MKNKFLMILAIGLFSSLASFAFDAPSFNEKSFKENQAKGEAILVDVYAKWCPTCKKQHAELVEIFNDEKYKGIKSYKLDYDDKDLVKKFSNLIGKPIPRQSTIVVLKGKEIVAFSIAETGEKLKSSIDKAL